MVQTDLSQLSTECADWRQILRSYRDEFNDCEKALLEMCKKSLTKDHLTQVEHFQNQFDIQLKNIHDLKQTIKKHERRTQSEIGGEKLYAEHENLLSEFLSLESTLQELREEFKRFINNTSC
ncbi:MAG: hypothetical protein M3Y85_11025 [Bacteroidota bacterium]|nr:hypothetical protein [Bacteroidota bacterium]